MLWEATCCLSESQKAAFLPWVHHWNTGWHPLKVWYWEIVPLCPLRYSTANKSLYSHFGNFMTHETFAAECIPLLLVHYREISLQTQTHNMIPSAGKHPQ